MKGFLVFARGVGIGDDAGSDLVTETVAIADERADSDVERAFAVIAEPADGAAVDATRFFFEFADDLHGAFFRRAGDAAAGETGGHGLNGVGVGT